MSDHQPAYTIPIPAKKAVEKSPQLSNAELSQAAYIGLQASSRRIAVLQAIDILLRHNPDFLDHFEDVLAKAAKKINSAAA